MLAQTRYAVAAGALVLALAGCSAGDADEAESTPSAAPSASASSTPSASATPTSPATAGAAPQLTDAELAAVFTKVDFIPDQYATTSELIDSIYPGLTASDPSCLAPFGVGWDTDAAADSTTVEFGSSIDRSITGVVASTGDEDAASALVAESAAALAKCADNPSIFSMQGMDIDTQVEEMTPEVTGADESLGWRVTGTVGGSPFTLVGITARVGGNAVAVVAWDPGTNEEYAPLATQMFVNNL
jgi:hypothetical protein